MIDGVIAAVLSYISNTATFDKIVGQYIPDYFDKEKKLTTRSYISKGIFIIVVYMVIKLWGFTK
jgi:hypothetical protein